jgi:hypothetical protein
MNDEVNLIASFDTCVCPEVEVNTIKMTIGRPKPGAGDSNASVTIE